MKIEYTNRKNEKYYLHEGITKKGNPKYYFSKKEPKEFVTEIPEGFEIYETPNAMVFLRKIPPKIITDNEKNIIEEGMKKYSNLKYFQIEVKNKHITIHLPNQDMEKMPAFFAEITSNDKQFNDLLLNNITYSPELRFTLKDQSTREFMVERMYYGSHYEDEWLILDSSKWLEGLTKKYIPHLGQESFFDLH